MYGPMTGSQIFDALRGQPHFRPVDLHMARLLSRLSGTDDPMFFLTVCLVSKGLAQGDVCLDLKRHSGALLRAGQFQSELPPLEQWTGLLQESAAVGRPGQFAPLILDERCRLYFHRFFSFERSIARELLERSSREVPLPPHGTIAHGLDSLFPTTPDMSAVPVAIDWQRVAALAAARSRLCIISGGPGTGKTTTVAKVLALLLLIDPGRSRIGLAAPTGKAAARLQEAISRAKQTLPLEDALRERIPENASTIHRLLGSIPLSGTFRHDSGTPLPLDILVVDEASMVDLSLMHRLLQALPPECGLILLGDRDQLASVEGGAVLGDICSDPLAELFTPKFTSAPELAGQPQLPSSPSARCLSDSIVILQRSYRFSGGGLEPLRLAIRDQDSDRVIELLDDDRFPDIRLLRCASPSDLGRNMEKSVLDGYEPLHRAQSPQEAFAALDLMRVLTPLREGPYGLIRLNSLIEGLLIRRGLLDFGQPGLSRGRPLMIERNDYGQQLFNGDFGIVWPSAEGFQAFFQDRGGMRGLPLSLLPAHQTAYALTVHKSQGSEFDHVLFVLPDQDLPILTREILYTGVTRARKTVSIIGSEAIVRACVARRTTRSSGLADLLWPTAVAEEDSASATDAPERSCR
jgi:exodeoxyribonuclease V alpha subunit